MDFQIQLKHKNDEAVLAAIRSYLTLSEYGVFGSHTHAVNVDLLTAAGKRLAAAVARITELEAKLKKLDTENAGLVLDKLTAPDGIKITPSPLHPAESGPSWQDYDVRGISGELPHYSMIRVVRRMAGSQHDVPAVFAAIERRLLAGNPVEA
ncbi:hypothetical protein [Burkholderia mayonis]|uniref:Uncharacterized protein n=1 Tax=Burkholderia mayonis TaxID=1385591 RepID=A0A1B4G137_9BURK|nr:hypothetical protein [Burkholderia mayonis]AOJ09640.1 hypothetical protein WS71_20210 [Burkholderia mayonis]KVE52261.1 hypothetical protein WS71_10035 [Burkholderia mayonis]